MQSRPNRRWADHLGIEGRARPTLSGRQSATLFERAPVAENAWRAFLAAEKRIIEALDHRIAARAPSTLAGHELTAFGVGHDRCIPGDVAAHAPTSAFDIEQRALIWMAKLDAHRGVSPTDAAAYAQLGREIRLPVRGPESHPNRPHGRMLHLHVGPVGHVPVRPRKTE